MTPDQLLDCRDWSFEVDGLNLSQVKLLVISVDELVS